MLRLRADRSIDILLDTVHAWRIAQTNEPTINPPAVRVKRCRDKEMKYQQLSVPSPCNRFKGRRLKLRSIGTIPHQAPEGRGEILDKIHEPQKPVAGHFPLLSAITLHPLPPHTLSTLQNNRGIPTLQCLYPRNRQACMSLMNGDLSPGFSCFLVRGVEVNMQVMHIAE